MDRIIHIEITYASPNSDCASDHCQCYPELCSTCILLRPEESKYVLSMFLSSPCRPVTTVLIRWAFEAGSKLSLSNLCYRNLSAGLPPSQLFIHKSSSRDQNRLAQDLSWTHFSNSKGQGAEVSNMLRPDCSGDALALRELPCKFGR